MMLKALIVEQLEADGTLRSFMMQPASYDGKIIVAFPGEYQDRRRGPVHFLDESDEERFAAGFGKCRARRLGPQSFRSDGQRFHVDVGWSGIPTKANWLSYYALSLPQHAIPSQLSVRDPHNPTREYRRYVTRDDERQRYVIFLECVSKFGRFDFELSCECVLDPDGFPTSSYTDPKTSKGYGRTGDDWKHFLPEREKRKVQQFFIESIHMGDTYSAGQAGAMGPQAHAHDMSFQQISASDMRTLAIELGSLRREMKKAATDPDHDIAIGQIAAAEAAAQKGDSGTVMRHLKDAGKWAFDVATKIGVSVACESIKKSLGM